MAANLALLNYLSFINWNPVIILYLLFPRSIPLQYVDMANALGSVATLQSSDILALPARRLWNKSNFSQRILPADSNPYTDVSALFAFSTHRSVASGLKRGVYRPPRMSRLRIMHRSSEGDDPFCIYGVVFLRADGELYILLAINFVSYNNDIVKVTWFLQDSVCHGTRSASRLLWTSLMGSFPMVANAVVFCREQQNPRLCLMPSTAHQSPSSCRYSRIQRV